jgi:hypothetical protein
MLLLSPKLKERLMTGDRVMGVGRLPEYKDRENLPYINALCKEVYDDIPRHPLVSHTVSLRMMSLETILFLREHGGSIVNSLILD